MKTISLLLLSLMMVLVNPAFPGTGRNGAGGAMSQDDVTAVKQEVTTQSDQAAEQTAQPEKDAAQDPNKAADAGK